MRLLEKIRERSNMMNISKEDARHHLETMGKKIRTPMGIGTLIVGLGVIVGSVLGVRYYRKNHGISSKISKLHKSEKKTNRLADTAAVLASLSTAAGLIGRYLRR